MQGIEQILLAISMYEFISICSANLIYIFSCAIFFWSSRYEPGIGYHWDFFASDETHEQHSTNLSRRRNRIRRILDTRPPGFERTEEEEEGIRASEAIERILCML